MYDWDTTSYVLRSDYRVDVVSHLARTDQATPSQLAEELGVAQPNVSRALSELREKDVVELLVPEETTRGRYYGLTELGDHVHDQIEAEAESTFSWTSREPDSASERQLLDALQSTFGTHLRAVTVCEGSDVTLLYLNDRVAAQYSTEELESTLRDLRYEKAVREYGSRNLRYLVRGFEEYVLCGISVTDEVSVSISVERGHESGAESLAENVRGIVERTFE